MHSDGTEPTHDSYDDNHIFKWDAASERRYSRQRVRKSNANQMLPLVIGAHIEVVPRVQCQGNQERGSQVEPRQSTLTTSLVCIAFIADIRWYWRSLEILGSLHNVFRQENKCSSVSWVWKWKQTKALEYCRSVTTKSIPPNNKRRISGKIGSIGCKRRRKESNLIVSVLNSSLDSIKL